ncbi:MAG TPA: 6-phosphogluconolactonase, partial [Solirubrobacteraceae bacterium]|nr:6-phosphogluconolactonase [Solirubrobacteraceae bacterium]
MTRLTTCPHAEAVAARAAALIVRQLARARQERGVAHLALSGGTTPKRTYELLAAEADALDAVEVWFADERCVAPEHPDSNYLLAEQALLGPAAVPGERVHRMRGELGPGAGASSYSSELRSGLPDEDDTPVLDLIVLGIGPDGHVASLFP